VRKPIDAYSTWNKVREERETETDPGTLVTQPPGESKILQLDRHRRARVPGAANRGKVCIFRAGHVVDSPTARFSLFLRRFPTLCPDLESITLGGLPRHPLVTKAVSGMFLVCSRNNLQEFHVDSPLTDEAREVVFRLPRLSALLVDIQGPTSLPTVPNLTAIGVGYDHDLVIRIPWSDAQKAGVSRLLY